MNRPTMRVLELGRVVRSRHTRLRTTTAVWRRRNFHASALRPLQHQEQQPPPDSEAKTEAPRALSKDEIAAFENGSHPSLQTPLTEQTLDSVHISTFAAPNTGTISLLTLNEPATRNALSKSMLTELRAHIDAIHAAPPAQGPRALILASACDRAFCAGANLKERARMSAPETRAFLAALRTTFARLAALPIPVIAAVHAAALGGGLELALCAALRVAAADAPLALPEAGLGIIPGAGGTHRLPAAIGRPRATRLMLTGQAVSGATALEWGLADYVVAGAAGARERVRAEALRVAACVALKAPLALRAILAALRDGRGGQVAEDDAYDRILGTADREEALRAFAEKRAPVFRGV